MANFGHDADMKLSTGMTLIEVEDGPSWSMDVFGTYRRVQAARDKAAKDESADMHGYLDLFKQLVKDAKGPELNDGQALELWNGIVLDLVKKNSQQETALRCIAMLPSSMESTPPDGDSTD